VKVNVHVERLVLEGMKPGPRERSILRSAFTAELSRLVAAGGLNPSFARGASVPAVPAGPLGPGAAFDAKEAGTRIARAVYAGLRPHSNGGGASR
jgi:hypothetical protein